jgi:hypothetical protein
MGFSRYGVAAGRLITYAVRENGRWLTTPWADLRVHITETECYMQGRRGCETEHVTAHLMDSDGDARRTFFTVTDAREWAQRRLVERINARRRAARRTVKGAA